MFHQAKHDLDLGYCPIPLRENSKKPAVEWCVFQTRRPTLGEITAWFGHGTRHNIGLVCGSVSGNLYVRDFDNRKLAEDFFRKFRERIRTIVETPRPGWHFYFRGEGRNFQGEKQDGRGEGGYVVAPPSVINGKQYKFVEGFGLVRPEELGELPAEQIEVKRRIQKTTDEVQKLEAWLMKIESVQGEGGNRGLVRFIIKCRDREISQARCMELLFRWNQSDRVQPPWSPEELVRAVENLYGGNHAAHQRIQ